MRSSMANLYLCHLSPYRLIIPNTVTTASTRTKSATPFNLPLPASSRKHKTAGGGFVCHSRSPKNA